jgi:glutamate N-acetyltransferase/amino-acid N-acetyltransferase
LPKGFFAAGINCGVRRYRPDLGLILSDHDASAAGVFTRNQLKAAPILYSQELLPSSGIRAIVTNSGQANAATGFEGRVTNEKMVTAVASELGVGSEQVLSASTGVIGEPLHIEKIVSAIPNLAKSATDTADSFALAILTTDLVPKTVTTTVLLQEGEVRVTGISKGSGMIHPNMGTMLGYLLTDAVLSPQDCQEMLTIASDESFNMISVDGEVSTNDCVFLLANGASSVSLANASDREKLQKAFIEASQFLAMCIARDGEGASKLIEVQVSGPQEIQLLRRLAKGLITSPLVKTAIHGEDPNWGRIVARLGSEGADPEMLNLARISIQGHCVFERGGPSPQLNRESLRQDLRKDTVVIAVEFAPNFSPVRAWGCDLTKKYVEINAEYTT